MFLNAVLFAIGMFAVRVVVDLAWGDQIDLNPGLLGICSIFGFLFGLVGWLGSEARYRQTLSDKKIVEGLRRARS